MKPLRALSIVFAYHTTGPTAKLKIMPIFRLYAASTSAGKLRDFRTAAKASSIALDLTSSRSPESSRFPLPRRTATPSSPTPQPRPSTIRVSRPAN